MQVAPQAFALLLAGQHEPLLCLADRVEQPVGMDDAPELGGQLGHQLAVRVAKGPAGPAQSPDVGAVRREHELVAPTRGDVGAARGQHLTAGVDDLDGVEAEPVRQPEREAAEQPWYVRGVGETSTRVGQHLSRLRPLAVRQPVHGLLEALRSGAKLTATTPAATHGSQGAPWRRSMAPTPATTSA